MLGKRTSAAVGGLAVIAVIWAGMTISPGDVEGVKEASPVGALVAADGGTFCTATLIRPNWAITAAHCLYGKAPSDVSFSTELNSGLDGATVAEALYVHPGYVDSSLDDDIALIKLSANRPEKYLALYSGDREALSELVGVPITHIGYGVTTATGTDAGVKRRVEVTLGEVLEDSIINKNLDVGGFCFGDSGGPGLMYDENGVFVVVSVNSGVLHNAKGTDACRADMLSVRVQSYQTWLDGLLPVLPDPLPPVADADVGVGGGDTYEGDVTESDTFVPDPAPVPTPSKQGCRG